MHTLHDFIEASAERALRKQRPDGSFPSGKNGPYNDNETPVRNTSHWLITLSHLYDKTGKGEYKQASVDAAEFLSSGDARPKGYTFHHRCSREKDSCNGLIGQAWSIEALSIASQILNEKRYAKIAKEVFELHPFLNHNKLWKKVDVDGNVGSVDISFNHQLWFAGAGSILANTQINTSNIEQLVSEFLSSAHKNIDTTNEGLILHRVVPYFTPKYQFEILKNDRILFGLSVLDNLNLVDNSIVRHLANSPITPVRRAPLSRSELVTKSIGYHSFNLYAFAILKENIPDHCIWQSGVFKTINDFIFSDYYIDKIENNEYAYPYNPPGFEIPYFVEKFSQGDSKEIQKRWLTMQLDQTFDRDTAWPHEYIYDCETLASRVYEVTRISDWDLEIE